MVSATITLASEAMAWIERSIPPSMMTKVWPVASTNRVAVSAARTSRLSTVRNCGVTVPTTAHRATSVRTGIHCRSISSRNRATEVLTGSHHVPDQVDLLGLVPGSGVSGVGDDTIAHHQHAVAQADSLLERVGGQDDAHALGGDRAHQLVDLFLGADVQAAGRMVEDQDLGAGVQPLGQHHL